MIAAGTAPAVPATLSAPRARSSGDRAFASGAKGRTFESCRAHLRMSLRRLLYVHADGSLRHAPVRARPQRVLRRRRPDGALGPHPRHARSDAAPRPALGDDVRPHRRHPRRRRDDGDDHLRDLAGDRPRRLPALGRLDPRLARALGDRRLGRRPDGQGVRERPGGPGWPESASRRSTASPCCSSSS